MPPARALIIEHHLLWTLYGHWLGNDPRGSGSEAVRDPKLATLGEIHLGRKPDHLQPSRGELRKFYQEAEPLLQFHRFWINEAKRQAVAEAVRGIVNHKPYTVWACAILSNHMHLVVRRHGDDAGLIWETIADAARERLREFQDVGKDHPVWPRDPTRFTSRRLRRCARGCATSSEIQKRRSLGTGI